MSYKSGLVRYIYSTMLSVGGISLHFFLTPHLQLIPFILALPAIFMISSLWGIGPSVLGTVIWSYGLSYYYFEPLYTVRVSDAGELIHLLFFASSAVAVSWIVDQSKKKEHRQSMAEAESRVRNVQLELENKLKDQFVNSLSHDLRNPLNVAMMCVEMITKKSTDSQKVLELSSKATRCLSRIDKMIQDLLDSRRISAGNPLNMDMDKFDLVESVRMVVDDFSSLHGDRFRMIGPEHLEFMGCQKYIQRAIENLVSNAIKYGDVDGPIEIGLKSNGEEVILWVKNRGNILAPEDIAKMLKPFGRLNPDDTSKEGWGIGLTLVKAIVEGHGGKLDITSNKQEGTNFLIRLPAKPLNHSSTDPN